MRFRAKSSMIPSGEGGLLSSPPSHGHKKRFWWIQILLALVALWFLSWTFLGLFAHGNWLKEYRRYPDAHPAGTKHTVKSSLRYIYPPLDDVTHLQQMGTYSLFTRIGDDLLPLTVMDEEDPVKQKEKEDALNAELTDNVYKNNFKNQRKVVFDSTSSSNSPKVVIVSLIDYSKYSIESIVQLIQNRVDYANKYNFGSYIRWTQEFIAEMNDFDFMNDMEKAKWARLFCLRAAMFAFPHADYFWYIDQSALIMNKEVDILNYLLSSSSLEAAMLRDKPLIPPTGIIKTYTNIEPEQIRLVFTQSKQKIETGSFVVKNDLVGRSILDIWLDKLYLQYNNFPYGPDSAITHLLQWHPYFLSKTALVPARMISSSHNPLVTEDQRESDPLNYYEGDLLAQWTECNSYDSCEAILKSYLDKLHKE